MQFPVSQEIIAIKRKYAWPLDTLRYRFQEKERYLTIGKKFDHRKITSRIQESYRKITLAHSFLWLWKNLPWVEMVLITGSTASLNAHQKDDIDFWVIVSPQKIWITRFIEGVSLILYGRRRMRNTMKVSDTFCINFYMTTNNLVLHKQTPEFAMQFVDAVLLYCRNNQTYKNLLLANDWVASHFPYWYKYQLQQMEALSYTKEKQKRSIFGFFYDFLDLFLGIVQIIVMQRKLPSDIKKILLANYFTTWKDSEPTH